MSLFDRRKKRQEELSKANQSIIKNREVAERAARESDYAIKFDLENLAREIQKLSSRKRKNLFELRRDLYAKQKGKCANSKCGKDLLDASTAQGGTFELDHVIPFSLGGGNESSNMQLLCKDCNRKKRASFSNEELLRYFEDILNNL